MGKTNEQNTTEHTKAKRYTSDFDTHTYPLQKTTKKHLST